MESEWIMILLKILFWAALFIVATIIVASQSDNDK